MENLYVDWFFVRPWWLGYLSMPIFLEWLAHHFWISFRRFVSLKRKTAGTWKWPPFQWKGENAPQVWVPLISRLRGGVDPILQTFASSWLQLHEVYQVAGRHKTTVLRKAMEACPPGMGRFEAGKVAGRTRNFWSLRRSQGFFVTGAFFFWFFNLEKWRKKVEVVFPPSSSDRWKHSGGWYLLWLLCSAHGHGSSPLSCGISGGSGDKKTKNPKELEKRGHREVVPTLDGTVATSPSLEANKNRWIRPTWSSRGTWWLMLAWRIWLISGQGIATWLCSFFFGRVLGLEAIWGGRHHGVFDWILQQSSWTCGDGDCCRMKSSIGCWTLQGIVFFCSQTSETLKQTTFWSKCRNWLTSSLWHLYFSTRLEIWHVDVFWGKDVLPRLPNKYGGRQNFKISGVFMDQCLGRQEIRHHHRKDV